MDAVFVPGATKDDLSMEAVRKYMKRSVEKGRRSYSKDDDPWGVLLKLEWVKSETEITRAPVFRNGTPITPPFILDSLSCVRKQ